MLTLVVVNDPRYHSTMIHAMIRSFANRDTERIFRRQRTRRLAVDVQRVARRRLLILDAADRLNDLRVPPGNRLEKLTGNRNGQHSIRINDRWRICFRWNRGDAYDVGIVDYH